MIVIVVLLVLSVSGFPGKGCCMPPRVYVAKFKNKWEEIKPIKLKSKLMHILIN